MNISKKEFYKYIYKINQYKYIKNMLKLYKQHGITTVLVHSRNVAYRSYVLAKKIEKRYNLKFDYEDLIIGAYLHDLYLYDWHKKDKSHKWHGFTHPKKASENAQELCNINLKEQQIIESHMWPLTITKPPKSREAAIVCAVDKYSALLETIKRK